MEICSIVKQEGIKFHTKHPLFCTWRMMNYRCYSDVHTSFATYGGAGITVCKEWRWDNPTGFVTFLKDVGERPVKFTLDRVDPYGSYCPENCRWADKKTQQNNFRRETATESGHLGVVKDAASKKWMAQIYLNGQAYCVNLFTDLNEAISAREQAWRVKVEQGDDAAYAYIQSQIEKGTNGKRFYGRKTSKYFGVSWNKRNEHWRACLHRRTKCGKLKQISLGSFDDEELANKAVLDFLEKEKNESCI